MKEQSNQMEDGKLSSKLKEKSDLRVAWSWLGSHVAALVICLILSFSFVSLTESTPLRIAIGILSLLMYFMLAGGGAWKLGNDDLNKVKFNRRKKDMLRGFKVGLLTSVPMFLFALALILAKAELLPNFYIIYKLLNGHTFIFLNFIDGTFRGIADTAFLTIVSWPAIIGVCSLTLVPPIICAINYILGYKDLIVMDKLMYKKTKPVKKAE